MADVEPVIRAQLAEARGAVPSGAGATAARRVLETYRHSFTETNHPLQVAAGTQAPTRDAANALIDANIGTAFNAAGAKIRSGAEITRHADATTIAGKLDQIIQGRNLNVLAADLQITGMVESIILQNPTFAAEYNSMSAVDRQNYREGMLRKKSTVSEIARMMGERMGVDKLIQDNTEQLRNETENLNQQIQDLQKQRTALETQLKTDRDEHVRFSTRKVGGVVQEGMFVVRLKQLHAAAEPDRAAVEALTKELESLREQRDNIIAQKTNFLTNRVQGITPQTQIMLDTYDADRQTIEKTMKAREAALAPRQKSLAEKEAQIKGIEDRRETLEAAIKNGEESLKTTKEKLATLNPQLAEKMKDYHNAITKRAMDEANFVSSLERILPEAIAATLNGEMNAYMKQQIEIEAKTAAEAKTGVERRVREALLARYTAAGGVNWTTFNADWNGTFLNQGAEAGLDAALRGQGVPPADIKALRADTDTYNQVLEDYKTRMANLRLSRPRPNILGIVRAGPEPLTEQEGRRIILSLGDSYLEKMVTSNNKTKEIMKNSGGLVDKTFGEWFKGLPWSTIAMIIALLFGMGLFAGARSG